MYLYRLWIIYEYSYENKWFFFRYVVIKSESCDFIQHQTDCWELSVSRAGTPNLFNTTLFGTSVKRLKKEKKKKKKMRSERLYGSSNRIL